MLGHQPFSEFGFSDIGITYNKYNYNWSAFTLYIQEEAAMTGDILSQISKTLEIDTSLVEVI
jgi:hypothetical protein